MEFTTSLPHHLQPGSIWRCRGSHAGQYRRVRQVNRRNVVVEPTGRGARHHGSKFWSIPRETFLHWHDLVSAS